MSKCPGCGKPVDRVGLPDIWVAFFPNHEANEMQEQYWHKLCLAAQLPEVKALVAAVDKALCVFGALPADFDEYHELVRARAPFQEPANE